MAGRWRIGVAEALPAMQVAAFETALDPFCAVVLSNEDPETGLWSVDGHADAEPDAAALDVALRLAAAARGFAVPGVIVEPLADRDWLADNAAGFEAVTIGRFFVHEGPDPAPPGRIGLRVAAGEAFGTGRHGSTAGCLLALTAMAGRGVRAGLDFGCGSGILALAMAKAFRAPVVAADIDPRAVAVTRANTRSNGETPRVRAVVADGYEARAVAADAPYDLVCCNILARPLTRLAAGLGRVVNPGGVAVLSGFLPRDGRRVLAAQRAAGFHLIRALDVDGWRTLVVRARPALQNPRTR